MSDPQGLKHSPIHPEHLRLGGRLVPFAGWEMPVQYSSIIEEHVAVREGVGIFDISHMGEFLVDGDGAGEWLNGLLTNNVHRLEPGQGQYTLLCNSHGGVVDDLIVYRRAQHGYFMVVNAAKVSEDAAWFRAHARDGIDFADASDRFAAMAVQGPKAAALYEAVRSSVEGAAMPELPSRNGIAECRDVVVCRTGYTGEDGFEFFCPAVDGASWWRRFVGAGARPCGLGARDSLRLEMGFPLNGSDLTPDHTPLEAGLGVFVDLGKEFVGSDVMRRQKEEGVTRRLAAFRMTAPCPPPRAHYKVLHEGREVGEVTSGGLSLTPGTAAEWGGGMAYLPNDLARPGTAIEIAIRSRMFPAVTVKKPIYRK